MYKKVYFDKEHQSWFVDELEDIYFFKSVNFETNLTENQILSWSRSKDVPNGYVRVYDVEIDGFKYYFSFKYLDDRYKIVANDSMELENLLNKKSLFFAGETIN
jgi:predicted glycosyl hydrolase (DUF1957 family)